MIANRVHDLYVLENLSDKDTPIHRLHPGVKILATFVFIIVTVSFNRYDVLGVVPYFLYPTLVMSLAEIPYKLLLSRFLIALPFCAFAGVTNLLLDRQTAFVLGGAAVSFGLLSLITILLRAYLCVMAVFLLIATTPFTSLTRELRRFHVPAVFILLIEMIYRYIGVLVDEASSMSIAYKLRSVDSKGIAMKHMGSFVGQLAIRSMDRGERIYAAMMCRGYSQPTHGHPSHSGPSIADICVCAVLIAAFLLLRVFPVLHML
ncbi:MAG: cobalt ECF transporter T component CbiQ [Clostridiales Family XIII bacterium]|jgi:cobalt/nickel transport system permease protein|nr:cobalt ECF transporter T component CbiQ [Clostridiales Family XIII bacterium]